MSSSNTAGQVGAGASHVMATRADVPDDFIGKADHRSLIFHRRGE